MVGKGVSETRSHWRTSKRCCLYCILQNLSSFSCWEGKKMPSLENFFPSNFHTGGGGGDKGWSRVRKMESMLPNVKLKKKIIWASLTAPRGVCKCEVVRREIKSQWSTSLLLTLVGSQGASWDCTWDPTQLLAIVHWLIQINILSTKTEAEISHHPVLSPTASR